MEFMEILLFWLGGVIGAGIMYMYLDLRDSFRTSKIKEEIIIWVEKNDKIFRILRNFIEKEHPEILEKLKKEI